VAGIVKGARAITADTALRLGAYFGVSAEMWLNLQAGYDLRRARQTTSSCRMMHKTSRRARLREAPILREPNWLRSPKGTVSAAETWSAFHPPDGGQVFPPGDEGADERQKECLAEPSERGIWFQVKGLPNDIGVIFLEDNPQTKVLVQSGAPFLNQGNLDGETARFGFLGGNGKQ
jgi:hypothetical protein